MYSIEELKLWYDEKYCLEKVKEDGFNIQYCKNLSEKVQLEAVKQNGYSIQYIDVKKYPSVYEQYILIYM